MKCSSCGYDHKELLEERNRYYRFILKIAEMFAETEDTKETIGEMLEKWLEEELK